MSHVLIIEDDFLVAADLTHLVEQAGATSVTTACTEEEAVQAAHARTPDIILSDVNLLVGTGPGAVRTILADQGEVPVIFITASPEACETFEPPIVVLHKPINPIQVADAIERLAPMGRTA